MRTLAVTLNYCDNSADVAFLYGLTILNVVFHCTWTFKISVVSRVHDRGVSLGAIFCVLDTAVPVKRV
jgi:hypothetical protein